MPASLRTAKDLVQVGVLRGAVLAARAIPAGVAATGLACALRLAGRRRLARRSLENLDLAYGDSLPAEEKRRIVASMIRNLARTAIETAALLREGSAYAARVVDADASIDRLRGLFARGRGVLGISAHFGCFPLIPVFLAHAGFPIGVIRARMVNDRLDRHFNRFFQRAGVRPFIADDPPLRLVSFLRQGGGLGVVPDQDIDRVAGAFIPFFGRPALTPTGPATIARLAGAPIVPLFVERVGDRHRLSFDEPIEVPRTADRAADVLEATRAWSAAVEARVRARPDHWVWFHRRWRSTPERLLRRGRGRRATGAPAAT